MNEPRFDVIGVGNCAVDLVGTVTTLPSPDTKNRLDTFTMQGGGPAATALVALSRLGARVSYLAKLDQGQPLGRIALVGLTQEGVDVSGVIPEAGAGPPVAFVLVESKTGIRTIYWSDHLMRPLGPEDVDPDFITSCRVLHLDEYQLPAARRAARIARTHGITTVLDAETPGREGLAELLPWIDYLVVPEEFARGFGDDDSLEAAMARLQDRGPQVVVVTRGGHGSMVRAGDRCFAQAAFSVPVVDTTGCGDVFHGGFIFGLLQEWPLEVITEFASAVAALKCGQPGGRAGCPSRAQVGQFLGWHGSDRTRAVLEAAGKGTSE